MYGRIQGKRKFPERMGGKNNYKHCLEINGDVSNLGDKRSQSKTMSGS